MISKEEFTERINSIEIPTYSALGEDPVRAAVHSLLLCEVLNKYVLELFIHGDSSDDYLSTMLGLLEWQAAHTKAVLDGHHKVRLSSDEDMHWVDAGMTALMTMAMSGELPSTITFLVQQWRDSYIQLIDQCRRDSKRSNRIYNHMESFLEQLQPGVACTQATIDHAKDTLKSIYERTYG